MFCNFTGGVQQTCISATKNAGDLKSWSGHSIWFSDMLGGFKVIVPALRLLPIPVFISPHSFYLPSPHSMSFVFLFSQLTYDISRSQLQFIRAASRHAVQSFTYKCRNSAAAVIFRTQDNKEIAANKVTYDGCKVSTLESEIITHKCSSLSLSLPLSPCVCVLYVCVPL